MQGPSTGVRATYKDALSITAFRLFKSLEPSVFTNITEVTMHIHDGLDGSGDHSIYNQIGAADTNTIVMYRFRIQSLTHSDNVLWQNPRPGSSSSCRPLLLLMGKESYENLSNVPEIQKERLNLTFPITLGDKVIQVNVHSTLSMIDGKLRSLLTGLHGAFCVLCTASREIANDTEKIRMGFEIDRSFEQIIHICNQQLHIPSARKKGDYEIRQGVTQVPLTIENLLLLTPPHTYLRVLDW